MLLLKCHARALHVHDLRARDPAPSAKQALPKL